MQSWPRRRRRKPASDEACGSEHVVAGGMYVGETALVYAASMRYDVCAVRALSTVREVLYLFLIASLYTTSHSHTDTRDTRLTRYDTTMTVTHGTPTRDPRVPRRPDDRGPADARAHTHTRVVDLSRSRETSGLQDTSRETLRHICDNDN